MASWKIHTDYGMKNMEELQRVVGWRFAQNRTVKRRAGFFSWGAGCFAIGLYLALQKNNVTLAVICCVVGSLMLAYGLFFFQVSAWTALRAMGGNKGGTDFTLDKTGIFAERCGARSHFDYDSCTHLLETNRNFYVVTRVGQGLILDKEQIKGGSAEELRQVLEERCDVTTEWMGKGAAPWQD